MTRTSDIDLIVQDILSSMSLRDKAAIANLDEGDIIVEFPLFDFEKTMRVTGTVVRSDYNGFQ